MRNLFELLYYIREILLLLLAVVISLMLLLSSETTQSMAMQKVYAGIIGSIPRVNFGFAEYLSYKSENETLRQQLMRYTLLNAELADVARENEDLKAMLQFNQRAPYELQVAEVISRGASSVLSTLTLNVGEAHGVAANQPVLTLEGLIGKTMTVAENATVLHLITDRNFRLSVKVGSEGLRGIMRPLYGQFAEVEGIANDGAIGTGDLILTSGFSDIYPKDLPVGEVVDVSVVPGETSSRVRARLFADPSESEHVFVMVSGSVAN
ncbi:rod shape-determining protein MreC [Candidatus Neomarinimicrobiota bacterium]